MFGTNGLLRAFDGLIVWALIGMALVALAAIVGIGWLALWLMRILTN